MLDRIRSCFVAAADSGRSQWEGWPFTSFGYEGGFWPSVARFVLVAVILGAIALFLRFLFGPKGRFREDWMETIQEAKAREAKEREEAERNKQTLDNPDENPETKQKTTRDREE